MTHDLLLLADWLREQGVTHVAMESTGVYWKPIWHILEGQVEILLVNARRLKAVPRRKTDLKDCEWIAELDQEIERHNRPFQQAATRLMTIPGVDRITASSLLAEIGKGSRWLRRALCQAA